jgi:hypothetical protein
VLDINLNGEKVYPVARVLDGRGTPFVFMTAYASETVDPRFRNRPTMRKPVDFRELAQVILGTWAIRTRSSERLRQLDHTGGAAGGLRAR